jgi:hypothetical protein
VHRYRPGRVPERCIPSAGMEPGIPRRASIGRLSIACGASGLCVGVDEVVLIAVLRLARRRACSWSGPTRGQPTVAVR